MTALATGLALLPFVVFGERPGQEIENPMAIVILGGLATSTLMNLFVLPALYLHLGRPGGGVQARRGRRGREPAGPEATPPQDESERPEHVVSHPVRVIQGNPSGA